MENIKQHKRDIQKKFYYLHLESNKNNKKIYYYKKFFTSDYVNNLLNENTFFETIKILKIERLKQRAEHIKKQKEIIPIITFNF